MTTAGDTHRVLVIAYYFPPLGLSGVQRTLKFVRYLPEFGWRPTVLTVEERGYFAQDETLLRELDGLDVDVIRTHSLDPLHLFRRRKVVRVPSRRAHGLAVRLGHLFFVPDTKIGWKPQAMRAARALMQSTAFDLLYATAPPYTDFLIARDLKREFGVPLVLDYRDPWLSNPLHTYPTPLHRFLHHSMELSVVRQADHIITINRRLKEMTLRTNDTLTHHDISIIPQGYDPEDFADPAPPSRRKKLRITYTGTFYTDRTPKYLFQAVRALFDADPSARNAIEICIAGLLPSDQEESIRTLGIADAVDLRGYLPHRECVALMRDSDVLWLMIPNGQDATSTGKLYEYLGARKPVLATVPDCSARQTLEKSGAAFLTDPDDVAGIARTLGVLRDLHRRGALPTPSEDFVSQFDRRRLTGRLARIFSGVLRSDGHDVEMVE